MEQLGDFFFFLVWRNKYPPNSGVIHQKTFASQKCAKGYKTKRSNAVMCL